MIQIAAGSRLHFGLLALATTHTPSARRFGGAGLMIKAPGLVVRARPAATWTATGPCAARALAFGRRFIEASATEKSQAFAIDVERCPAEHLGLGTGTQLGLSVARALARCNGWELPVVELARRIGRGERSGIGIHGFEQGGFLVDGGRGEGPIAPLIARHPFPEEWHILLVAPKDQEGAHGQRERDAFAHMTNLDEGDRNAPLCRILLLGMLPALVEHDLAAFGEALCEFNRRVGEMFAPWQGGVYANPQTASVIEWLRGRGIKGVGQSSWGPAAFAIGEQDRLGAMRSALLGQYHLDESEVVLTTAENAGAVIQQQAP